MSQRLTLTGEATIFQAAELHHTLLDALSQQQPLLLDLSQITEFDCSAAQLLMWLTREGQRLERPVRLVAPAAPIRELVALLGLESALIFEEA